jgi:hypothetical protein
VPKVVSNFITINDRYGAFLAYLFLVRNDRYLETVVLVQSDSRWLVHPWLRAYH